MPDEPAAPSIEGLDLREGLDDLTPTRITTLYRRAPLHRTAGSAEDVWAMFEASSLVVTAWHQGQLVGLARVLTDGVLFSYLCDLAVEPDVQGVGIGKALLERVTEMCEGTQLVLRGTGRSSGYYARLGFRQVEDAWVYEA